MSCLSWILAVSLGCADFHLQMWIFPPIRHHWFLFYLFALLTLLFSQIWTIFFHVMCCFIFPIPSPFFLCHFCFVILAACNFSFLFASCLFFIPIFALFLIFLYRSAKLLSLSFFPLFIYQQPVTVFWIIAPTFSFCLFFLFPFTFSPTLILYFFVFSSFSSTTELMIMENSVGVYLLRS